MRYGAKTASDMLDPRRHHANHGVRSTGELYGPSDDVGITSELVSPESVTEDCDTVFAGQLLLGKKGSAESRLESQHEKEIMRDPHGFELLRTFGFRELEVVSHEERKSVEDVIPCAVVEKVGR